jgi:zinc transport system substrate-binding protein
VREVGRDKVDAVLLVPPGVEPHEYEPTPADIVRINQADVFIYTDDAMEPWVARLLPGITNQNLLIAEAGHGAMFLNDANEAGHAGAGEMRGDLDPHIWLDFDNDRTIVDNVADELATADEENKDFYLGNVETLKARLADLDLRYAEGLKGCRLKSIIYGGHFAFGYLAKRYGLEHVSPYRGFSPNAEPTPKAIAELIGTMRSSGAKVIYYEELIDPRVARVIAEETGAEQVLLSAAHNVTADELQKGVTFLEIMEDNLVKLRKGLECP